MVFKVSELIFENFIFLVSRKFSICENRAPREHFFRLYLRAEGSNRLEIARFVDFRQCRYGLKKIRWKNFTGARRYDHLLYAKKSIHVFPVCLTSFVEPLIFSLISLAQHLADQRFCKTKKTKIPQKLNFSILDVRFIFVQ